MLDTLQYNDTKDVFERPPFAILVQSLNQESGGVVFMLHLLAL